MRASLESPRPYAPASADRAPLASGPAHCVRCGTPLDGYDGDGPLCDHCREETWHASLPEVLAGEDDETTRAVALVSVLDGCAQVTACCVKLARLGCRILGAHVIRGQGRVLVAPPPLRAVLTCGVRRRTRWETVMATDVDGVQVEWRIPTARARGH